MSFQPCEPGGTQVTLWEGVCVCVRTRAQVTTSNYDPSCVKADTGAHVCVHLRSSALYNTHTHTHTHFMSRRWAASGVGDSDSGHPVVSHWQGSQPR